MKILSIVGTRPNFMKIAPIIKEFKKYRIHHILLHTGQHYDFRMSTLFFDELGLPKPDEQLSCASGKNASEQKKILEQAIGEVLKKQKPDLVIVVGDVTSTVAGAKAAHKLNIKVAHIESGLRSFDKTMPEEINRIQTDRISDLLFTTEKSGNKNLLNEGTTKKKIFFVGNVMIDTLLKHRVKSKTSSILKKLKLRKKEYCILTLHRPSNVDNRASFEDLLSILEAISGSIKIVFPIHPRTKKNLESFGFGERMRTIKNLILTRPLGYLDFLYLMDNSKLIFTDSGGIQEESTVLGVPCITLRENTERPVTVEEGTNLLVSINKEKVVKTAMEVLHDRIKLNNRVPRLWDGKSAQRIVSIILKHA